MIALLGLSLYPVSRGIGMASVRIDVNGVDHGSDRQIHF
jgi:hypothetical protein